jgi:CheY-like chemotaxis protein
METSGWTTLTARDGECALRQIEEHEPDVVLLDLALPRMSGLEVLRLLKSGGWRGPQPKVVLVSFYARLLTAPDLALADGVVSKPFEIDALVHEVERAAGRVSKAHRSS